MSIPSISIIVPVYNVEPYLRQCLDSLVNQTLRNIEIICVDDGSTDGSPAILQEYAAKDERIRVLTQSNGGLSAARNTAMKAMRAPYVMFCDSDDWYALDMCEVMYHAIDRADGIPFAMCGVQMEYEYEVTQERISRDDAFYSIYKSGITPLSKNMLVRNFSLSVCNKLFRRTFLLQHNIQFPEGLRYEDFYFCNICIAHATHVFFVQKKLYHYRQRLGSIMFDTIKKRPFVNIDRMRIAMLLWNYYKEHNFLEKWDGYIVIRWIQCLRLALDNERTKEARRCIVSIAREFIKDNDEHTRALSDMQRREIINLIDYTCSDSTIQAVKYRVKKICINLVPIAAWRRRLRKKYLPIR